MVVIPSKWHHGITTSGINSTGTVLVSGGKDGTICLWKTANFLVPLGDIERHLENLKPHHTFNYHKSPIQKVVWHPSDPNLFISGDSDGFLYLTDVFSRSNTQLYPFNGVKNPLIDISWSNDGRLVAWSTINGKVHLLDLNRNTYQELTSILKTEKLTPQRSIAFDPTNKYLVTMGDDTILRIYQYQYLTTSKNYQFKVSQHITRLMNQAQAVVHCKRLCWSPGGEYLMIPSSTKNKTTLITVLSRNSGWQNALNLVGHGDNCEVVKYNPSLFQKTDNENSSDMNYSNVVATAGSDNTLALWNTGNKSPICVLKDLVNSIVDITWLTSECLVFLSLDGYLSVATFTKGELGVEIDAEAAKALMTPEPEDTRPFNAKPESATTKRGSNTVPVLEGKDAISTNETIDLTENEPVSSTENVPAKAQDTSKTDLIPEVIPPPDMRDPSKNLEGSFKALDATNLDDILNSAMNARTGNQEKIDIKTNGTAAQNNGTQVNKLDVSKQKTSTKNGKKRITPLLVSNGGTNGSVELPTYKEPKSDQKLLMEFDKPSLNVPEHILKRVKNKRSNDDQNPSTKKAKRELEQVKFIGSVIVNPNTAFSKTRLATPKIRSGFLLTSTVENDESFILDVKNGSGNDANPTRITYYKKDRQIWTDFIPKFVHLAVEGLKFWALSTDDGSVYTYSHISGQRLLPPLILGSPLSFLESHGNFLMAITNIGEMYIWNLDTKKLHLNCPLSLNALLDNSTKYLDDGLSRSDKITLCSITSKGVPLVTLSNGSGYLFNDDLGSWQTITESWWAFGSHYWDSLHQEDSNKPQSSALLGNEADDSIIRLLENKTNEEIIRGSRTGRGKFFNKISKNMLMKEGFENLENTISISHLENRILCCEILEEKKDFHDFFISYVKRVCELGLKAKVYEICNQLLGPEDKQNWESTICGWSKHELLKEVILSCSQLRDSQRILTHFAKKIDLL